MSVRRIRDLEGCQSGLMQPRWGKGVEPGALRLPITLGLLVLRADWRRLASR